MKCLSHGRGQEFVLRGPEDRDAFSVERDGNVEGRGYPSLAARKNKMPVRAATVVQQLCKSCRACFMFYCMFYLTCECSFILRRGSIEVDMCHCRAVRSTLAGTCIGSTRSSWGQTVGVRHADVAQRPTTTISRWTTGSQQRSLSTIHIPVTTDLSLTQSAFFTARCTIVQSAVLPSHVVRLSVRLSVSDVGGLWSHGLEILETNCTDNKPNIFALVFVAQSHQPTYSQGNMGKLWEDDRCGGENADRGIIYMDGL